MHPIRRLINLCEADVRASRAAEQGYTVRAYHGTIANFDAFDPRRTGDIGMHFGTAEQADTASKNAWSRQYEEGSNVIPVLLKIRHPLRVKDMFSTLRTRYINRAKQWCLLTPGFLPNQEDHAAIYDAAKAADKARRKAGGEWGALRGNNAAEQLQLKDADRRFWQAIEASLKHQGYDGLIYANRVEGGGDSYVVFDPSQVRVVHATFDPTKTDSGQLLDSYQPQ